MIRSLLLASSALLFAGCAAFKPLPSATSIDDRLAMMPTSFAQLEQPVIIRWNEYAIPYIEAKTDDDAAFALGLVHAHLRLAQMEITKRIATGRISEMAGPFTKDIDEVLRILDFDQAASAMLAAMPEENRRWLDRYVQGVNTYKQSLNASTLPHEYALLSLENEPWTAEDTIALGRLFGTDFNWLSWFSLLPLSARDNFDQIYNDAVEAGLSSARSFEIAEQQSAALARLSEILAGFSKSGSNSVVISSAKSERGSGMIANDPHLGFNLPNAWIMAGLQSPSYHAVGMMLTGVPVFGFGRTNHLAWGGTNLRGLSSDLVDVSALDASQFVSQQENIKVRFWPDTKITRRLSNYGPIITDADMIPNPLGKTLAVRWAGHQISDEITSLLRMMKAKNGTEFLKAAEEFSVPGQNFLYVDHNGQIGHIIATHIPNHGQSRRDRLFVTPEQSDAAWRQILKAGDLPGIINQKHGYLVSANNKPTQPAEYDIGIFFPPDERVRRLNQLLGLKGKTSMADLMEIQKDVVSLAALELIDQFEMIDRRAWEQPEIQAFDALQNWDGAFRVDAKEPVLFMGLIGELKTTISAANGEEGRFDGGRSDRSLVDYLIRTMNGKAAQFADQIRTALQKAERDARGKVWGDIHRLELGYMQSRIPLIGRRYRVGDYPVPGSIETLMKTAHDITTDRHRTRYGAQSRHISDMGDPDANYFVLAGGNDGWISSQNANDQTPLWLRGDYIRMPLQHATIRKEFGRSVTLMPVAKRESQN
ncbi:MAG: penicillin acylase family protein, partial [Pseudomonadota bacterium]